MTAAYTNFDPAKPSGTSTPTVFAQDDVTNQKALRDMAMTGRIAGFIQSRVGANADKPDKIRWTNGAIGYQWVITWTGNQPTTIAFEWTDDTWATTASLGSAQVNTFTGANITSSTNSGGWVTVLFELWAKLLTAIDSLSSHTGATGTAVHGLGTMSTQAATAVNIDGGTIDGTILGSGTAAAADVTRLREAFTNLGTIAAAGTATLDWSTASHYAFTPDATTSSAVTVAVSNPPAAGKSQTLTLEIINGQRSADAKITWPASFKWIGGSGARPLDTQLEVSGRNIFIIQTRDGGTRYEIQHIGKGG
jgi:hypothetical protein